MESEEMLANIDRLYSEFLNGSAASCGSAWDPADVEGVSTTPIWAQEDEENSAWAAEAEQRLEGHAVAVSRREGTAQHPHVGRGHGRENQCRSSSSGSGPESSDRSGASRSLSSGHDRGPALARDVDFTGVRSSIFQATDQGDGEALLASIDRLYGEMLQSTGAAVGERNSAASVSSVVGEALPCPVGAAVALGPFATDSPRDDPVIVDVISADEGADAEVLRELLEEVLWSALLLGRGTGGRVDVEAGLLEFLPARTLGQCLQQCSVSRTPGQRGSTSLPSSLLQRLQAELPRVHAALMQPLLTCSFASGATAVPVLAETVRRARDGLLTLASSAEVSADDLTALPMDSSSLLDTSSATAGAAAFGGPNGAAASFASSISSRGSGASFRESNLACAGGSAAGSATVASRPPKPPPRRTSLSHWTPESLESLEPPKRRGSKQLAR